MNTSLLDLFDNPLFTFYVVTFLIFILIIGCSLVSECFGNRSSLLRRCRKWLFSKNPLSGINFIIAITFLSASSMFLSYQIMNSETRNMVTIDNYMEDYIEKNYKYFDDIVRNFDHKTGEPYQADIQKCKSTSKLIFDRLYRLQNPSDCYNAKKLICEGWIGDISTSIHQWIHCMIFAYATNRTMILDLRNWVGISQSYHENGRTFPHRLSKFFIPTSKCQLDWTTSISKREWHYNLPHRTHVVYLPDLNSYVRQNMELPPYFDYSMPRDIVYHTILWRNELMPWWIGHIGRFLMRPNRQLKKFLDIRMAKSDFQSPIVGIQARQAQDPAESVMQYLLDSMEIVEKYYDEMLKKNIRFNARRVYISTSDRIAVQEIKKRYPGYKIFTSEHPPFVISPSAPEYAEFSLLQFVQDIFFLSQCDYLVVTMTTDLDRLAYEFRETYFLVSMTQFTTQFKRAYFINFNNYDARKPSIRQGSMNCQSNRMNELNIRVNDIIDFYNYSMSDLTVSYGYSRRTKSYGYFASKCVTNVVTLRNYPDYSQYDIPVLSTNWSEVPTCWKSQLLDSFMDQT